MDRGEFLISIFGILGIVFFCKIWIMTEDIRIIKNILEVGFYKSASSTDDIGFRSTINPKTRKLIFEEIEIVT